MDFMSLPIRQLANLIHTLKHLFIPRTSNNHRPKVLLPQSLTFLAAFLTVINFSVKVLAQSSGGILGYASDITLQQVWDQVNQRRTETGLNKLTLNDKLSDAARRKAADMFTFDYWAHVNPQNGTDPWHFFDAVGYKYRYAGENLARDFAITGPMVQAWMDSPTHRENILSAKYQETGIAVVNGVLGGTETTLVVQLFGAQQAAGVAPQILDVKNQASDVGNKTEETIQPEQEVIKGSGSQKNANPMLSPLSISKAFGIATLVLLATVLIVDSIIISLRKTRRIAGRNWAHLAFIMFLIILVGSLQQGIIK